MECKPATYADLEALPDNRVGEIFGGVLHSVRVRRGPHTVAASLQVRRAVRQRALPAQALHRQRTACPVAASPLQSLPVVRMQVRIGVQEKPSRKAHRGCFRGREPDGYRGMKTPSGTREWKCGVS